MDRFRRQANRDDVDKFWAKNDLRIPVPSKMAQTGEEVKDAVTGGLVAMLGMCPNPSPPCPPLALSSASGQWPTVTRSLAPDWALQVIAVWALPRDSRAKGNVHERQSEN